MKFPVWIVSAALVASCQTPGHHGDEQSPFFQVPAGSRLVLHRELAVPAEDVSVYLQYGQVMPQKQLNLYHPQCKIEMRRRLPTGQTIRVDEFMVTRVTRDMTQHMVWLASIDVASAPLARRVSGGVDSGMGPNTFLTILTIASDRQPEVMRMTCGYWGYIGRGDNHLSIREIRAALGEVLTLHLPAAS